jgi:thymidine phosphorylase
LPRARHSTTILAARAGTLQRIDAGAVGRAATLLGAGRLRKEDRVDPTAGVTLLHKAGARVTRGQPLATVWYGDRRRRDAALPLLAGAFTIGAARPRRMPLVLETIE